MKRNRGPSRQAIAVLGELAQKGQEWSYGYELCQATGLKAGSMYPMLLQLAERDLLETAWEAEVPEGRPRRHLYRMTRSGFDALRESMAVGQRASIEWSQA
jgi:PadR family transcriptional regulator PadR